MKKKKYAIIADYGYSIESMDEKTGEIIAQEDVGEGMSKRRIESDIRAMTKARGYHIRKLRSMV